MLGEAVLSSADSDCGFADGATAAAEATVGEGG